MRGDGAASAPGQCRVSLPDVQIRRVLGRFGQLGQSHGACEAQQHTIDYGGYPRKTCGASHR